MSSRDYLIRPLEHTYSLEYPSFNIPFPYSDYPTLNVDIWKHGVKKRWGYIGDQTFADNIQAVLTMRAKNGNKYLTYLTDKDLAVRETGTGKTYSYRTPVYITGSVSSMNPGKTVVTGDGSTNWTTSTISVGDKFIIDSDDTSDVEEDTNWMTIKSIDGVHQITLDYAYTGSHTSGAYTIRKLYSVPSTERWSYAVTGGYLCFGNANINVQYWDGSTTKAADLDSTNAVGAKYMIEYDDRLCLLNTKISAVREPWTLKYSELGDVTHWDVGTYPTAGEIDFIDTEDYGTGLGKVGGSLVVYKLHSFIVGHRTGISTAPFAFDVPRIGIGLLAPYSLIHFMGTNAWLGNSDFYIMSGDEPMAIGEKIRFKFFDIVNGDNLEQVWGFYDPPMNKLLWFATTEDGQRCFCYDIKTAEWTTYSFWTTVTGGGMGLLI